jgi:hypothetical protein
VLLLLLLLLILVLETFQGCCLSYYAQSHLQHIIL